MPSGAVRFTASAGAARPATIEQYEQLLQRQAQLQARNTAMEQTAGTGIRLPMIQTGSVIQKPPSSIPQVRDVSIIV